MNNIEALEVLAKKYIERTGAIIQRDIKHITTEAQLKEVYRKARDSYTEGLAELTRLKLSPEERYGISKLRNYFKEAIRAMNAGMQGKYEKSARLMATAEVYAQELRTMLAFRAVRK
jgi:hypothetical protein